MKCTAHRKDHFRRRRPPRGGRGLKYAAEHDLRTGREVAPLAGGVD